MTKSEEEGSADLYKITLSYYSEALKDHPARRKPIQDVIDLYDRIRKGGNMNDDVQEQFFKDISTTKWSTSLKTAGSKHECYKALMGNGGRHENRRFSNWVIVSACWPGADKLPDIRAGMAKYWGLETFPDGEFPKVADDEQMKLYLGNLEKKHPSNPKSRTAKSSSGPEGNEPQKPDHGDDNDGSGNSDSSDGETDNEVMIDEESTKAAQEARDKTLREETRKAKTYDSDQVDQVDQVNKTSSSSGLTTMETIKELRANRSKANANQGAKRPAEPTPAMDPPPAKRASTHSASDLQALALADLLRDLTSDRGRLQKLEEESRESHQLREENRQLKEENRQLRERLDKVETAHYDLDKRHNDLDRRHAYFERETMDTLVVLLHPAQGKTTSEAA